MTRIVNLRQAVAAIPAGCTITCGGFQLNRPPMALVRELIRQRKNRLQLFLLPNPLPLDFLAGAGSIAFADVAFAGMEIGHRSFVAPNWRRAVESGRLRWRERDALYLIQALRAAAMGLPFLPLPLENGSTQDADVTRMRNPFQGNRVTLVRSLRPRVALLHAQAADRLGNLWIADPVTDRLLARASQAVIATSEKIVPRLPRVTLPSVWVDFVVHAPGGAWPGACPHHYPEDTRHLEEYLALSRAGRFRQYLRRHAGGAKLPERCAS